MHASTICTRFTDADRVKMLINLLGDLHQPMHVGYKKDDNGKAIPFNVKKGDKVLLPQYGGTTVKIDGVEYILVEEDSILGIVG